MRSYRRSRSDQCRTGGADRHLGRVDCARTGTRQRHIAAEGEFTSHLRSMPHAPPSPMPRSSAVDHLIVLATSTPDHTFATAVEVQCARHPPRRGIRSAGGIRGCLACHRGHCVPARSSALVIGAVTFSRISTGTTGHLCAVWRWRRCDRAGSASAARKSSDRGY